MRTFLGISLFFLFFSLLNPARASDESDPDQVGGKSLDQWIKEIKDRDPAVCENAIRTIPYFGKKAGKAGPAIISQLSHYDASVKANAAAILGQINQYLSKPDVDTAINALAYRMTEDRESVVAFHAGMSLYQFGTKARPVLPKLIASSKARLTWELRRAAVMALAVCGAPEGQSTPVDMRAIHALMDAATNDSCAMVRLEAVIGLGICGAPPAASDKMAELQVLQTCFKDRDDPVIIWAHASYMYINDGKFTEEHLSAIARYLKSPKLTCRAHAARALGTVGKEAKAFVSPIVNQLRDKEVLAAFTAAEALPKMGPAAAEAIPVLKELLQNKDVSENLKVVFKDSLKSLEEMKK